MDIEVYKRSPLDLKFDLLYVYQCIVKKNIFWSSSSIPASQYSNNKIV